MFTEIILKLSSSTQKKHLYHISKAKEHIEEAICNLFDDETGSHCSDLPKLQFILGQLEEGDTMLLHKFGHKSTSCFSC